MDAATREGIPDVILRVLGTDVTAATDARGEFTLRAVPLGEWELQVTHLRYGQKTHTIVIQEGVSVWLEVRVAEEAILLEELVVEAETAVERERRTTGASFWEVTREEIEAATGTSRHMGDLIRQTVPGLRLRQASNLSTTDICLEFRAPAGPGKTGVGSENFQIARILCAETVAKGQSPADTPPRSPFRPGAEARSRGW